MSHSHHTIHSIHHHFGWDNAIEPIKHIKSNEILEIETIDSSGAQLNSSSTVKDIETLDFGKVNPVTGPLFVEGAEVGDVIEVEFLDFISSGWGWTAIIPGFGLLADDFKNPDLNIWSYDKNNIPYLKSSQSVLFSKIESYISYGTHYIVVMKIFKTLNLRDSFEPLLYGNQKYIDLSKLI